MSKVPKLRFKEFSGDWEEKRLNEFSIINPKNSELPNEFIYIDLDSVESGVLRKSNKISSNDALSRAQRVMEKGDILYQTVRPYQRNNLYFNLDIEIENYVSSTGYAQLRTKQNRNFLFQIMHTDKFVNKVLEKCTGTSYPAINSKDLGELYIGYPTLPEQEEISSFLSSVDTKIEKIEKKVELLKQYKKGMMQKIFSQEIRFKDENGNDYPDWVEKELGEVCDIITGKLDANAMVTNGEYRFYTCAKDYYCIDVFAFDTEALLVSGNGANVGYIHYYKGKFNAYQRTYVLDNFNESINFTKCVLEMYLKKRIKKEKNEGNTPYILIGTLRDMKIQFPISYEQEKIANLLSSLDKKIERIEKELEQIKEFKKGLLQQMFV